MYIKSNFIPIELYHKFITNDPRFSQKSISIFNDYVPSTEELTINPVNILIIQEPNQLFGLHDWAIQNHQSFSCILTWGQQILDSCENAILLPFGTTFLHGKDKYKTLASHPKTFNLSFLCGSKKIIDGHFVRQNIFQRHSELKIPNKWIYTCPGDLKSQCFENSMFHLAVENSRNQNYFTEKIIDAFITKTIPLYRGCTNINDFFDSKGFFIFDNEDEFFKIANSLTEEDYYSRLEYIEKNYHTAIYYAEIFNRIADLLNEIIILNQL